MSEPAWFMGDGDRKVGPMDVGELRARLTDGRHGPETLVWREGMADWRRADEVGELRGLFAGGAGEPAMRSGGNAAPMSRDSTSNLLAILNYVALLVSGIIGVSFVFPIVVMAMKRDAFSLYHAKQAVTLLIVTFVGLLISIPLMFVLIGIPLVVVIAIGSFVLQILGLIYAAKGEMKPLPIVGGWAEAWWSGLRADA
jgi:uncharacterized membrane protein